MWCIVTMTTNARRARKGMWKSIVHNIILFILTVFSSIPFLLFDLVIFSNLRWIIILSAWIIFLIVVFLCGDKVFLSFLFAKENRRDGNLRDLVKNLSCKLDLGKVNVSTTCFYPYNIFYIWSCFDNPTIVVGDKVNELLSPNEIRAGIMAALLRIKKGDAKFRLRSVLLLLPFYMPYVVVKKFAWLKSLNHIANIYIFPFLYITNLILNRVYEKQKFDKEVIGYLDSSRAYISLFSKLSYIENGSSLEITSLFVDNIAITEDNHGTPFSNMWKSKNNVKRFETLKG